MSSVNNTRYGVSALLNNTGSNNPNFAGGKYIDDKGENILYDENNDERFPDFQLYVHISAHCRNGIPKEQLNHKLFQKYIVKNILTLPKDIKTYSLYV